MQAIKIILSIIIGSISVLMFVYAFYTSKEKGPILSNTYLFASEQERKTMDKSAEYHLVTIVFSILGAVFLLMAVRIFTSWTWLNFIIGLLIAAVIIYAILESIKTEMKR